MFKKLKERISEEVKSSPQRLQQITQSVSERLTTPNSTVLENTFFSIAEDEPVEYQNLGKTTTAAVGLTPLTSSPPASATLEATSTLWPQWEPYKMPEDVDSDVESTASSSSGVPNTNAVDPLQSQRYRKYRQRYSDVRHECTKLRQLLVDTQDKAIRRMSELREQCQLESGAKAHLEAALREELDERQMQIDSLRNTVALCKAGDQEVRAQLICAQTREADLQIRLSRLEKELAAAVNDNTSYQGQDGQNEQSLRARIAQLEADLAGEQPNRDRISRLQLSVSELEATNSALYAELETYKETTRKHQDLEQLYIKIATEETNKSQEANSMEALEQQIQTLTATNRDLEAILKQRSEEINNYKEISEKHQVLEQPCSVDTAKTIALENPVNVPHGSSSMEVLDQRIQALTVANQDLEATLKQRNEVIDSYKRKDADFQTRCFHLETQFETVNQNVDKLTRTSQEQIDSLTDTITSLHESVNQKTFEIVNYQQQLEDSKTMASNLEKQHSTVLDNFKNSTQQELDSFKATISDLEVTLTRRTDELEAYKQKYTNHLKESQQSTEEQINNLTAVIASLEDTLKQKTEEIEALKHCVSQVKNDYTALETQLDQVKETNQQRVDHLLTTITDLEGTLNHRCEQIDDYVKRETDLKAKHATLQVDHANLTQSLQTLQEKCDSSSLTVQQLDDLKEANNQLNATLVEKQRQVDTSLQQTAELKSRHAELQRKLALLTQSDTARRDKIDSLTGVIQQLEATVKQRTEQLEAYRLKDEEAAMKYLTLIQDLNDSQVNVASLTRKLRDVQTLNADIDGQHKQQLVAVGRKCDSLEREVAVHQERINQLLAEQQDVDVYRSKCADLETLNASIQQELDSLTSTNDTLRETVTALTQRVSSLQGGGVEVVVVDDGQLTADDDDVPANKLTDDTKSLRKKLGRFEELVRDVDVARERVSDLERRLTEQLARNEQLEASLAAAKRQGAKEEEGVAACQSNSLVDNDDREQLLAKYGQENDELNRRLKDALLALSHCAQLSTSSTEVEYLRNIVYNYMLGKESVVLARVIAAVCKFDAQQTERVLEREQHRQTLLGQLGFL